MEFKTKIKWTLVEVSKEPFLIKNKTAEWFFNEIWVKDATGRIVATVTYNTDHPNMGFGHNETIEKWKANALLISKAPEMLKMLNYLIEDEQLSSESIKNEVVELIKEATEF
jgi:hypothetical protein